MTCISTCSVNCDFIQCMIEKKNYRLNLYCDCHTKILEHKGMMISLFNLSCSDDKTYGDFPGHEIYELTCKLKDAHHGLGLVHST